MREIEYRGISKLTNEWIYGYYYNMNTHKGENELRHIIVYENKGPGNQTEHEPIDGTTLGQYTGLKDRDSKKIYEGDIVTSESTGPGLGCFFKGVVKFYDGTFYIDNEETETAIPLFNETNELKVISNIYQ